MFHFWLSLPPELRKYFTDWLPTETKFNLAACSVSSFYEALNSFDHITYIRVEPNSKNPSSPDVDSSRYQIHIKCENNEKKDYCWLDIIKKDETTSIVQFSVEDLQNRRKTKEWETEMIGAYEVVTLRFLEMLLRKFQKTLLNFEIIRAHAGVNELPFDSFNICHLKRLESLYIASENHDLLQCGFTNIDQLRSIEGLVFLGNTSFQLNHICAMKTAVLNQNHLTSHDILDYLKFLSVSELENRLLGIDLVDASKPNYIEITIKDEIKSTLERFFTVDERLSDATRFDLMACSENGSINVLFNFVMLDYWLWLSPELRKYFTDRLPTETKDNLAACSVSRLYEAFNSVDHVTYILVEPVSKSSTVHDANFSEDVDAPQYEIYIVNRDMNTSCWLDVMKKDESTSFVQLSAKEPQTSNKIIGWKTQMAGSYEVVAFKFLEKLIIACRGTLESLRISPPEPGVKELPFDSFSILHLQRLRALVIESKNHDLLECGFTSLEQVQSLSSFEYRGITSFPLKQICGLGEVIINQNKLTALDILECLEFLTNSIMEKCRLTIELVDSSQPNYIDMKIIRGIKKTLKKTSCRIERPFTTSIYFEVSALNENVSIKINFVLGQCIRIFYDTNMTIEPEYVMDEDY